MELVQSKWVGQFNNILFGMHVKHEQVIEREVKETFAAEKCIVVGFYAYGYSLYRVH